MDPVQAVILGIIQGILEWLPVSSQGVSSIIMTEFLNMAPQNSDSVAVFLHSGTAVSALVYFRKEFMQLIRTVPNYVIEISTEKTLPKDHQLMNFLVVATAFSGLSGLISLMVKDYIFQNIVSSTGIFTGLVGVALLITGILKMKEEEGVKSMDKADERDGALAGFLQGFAFIPGISRSGVTIFGLFLRDFSAHDAFKLSFLMSVPAVLMGQVAIGLYKGFKPTPNMLIAGFTAFIVGFIAIDGVLKLAERIKVEYVCFALAGLSFLFLLF